MPLGEESAFKIVEREVLQLVAASAANSDELVRRVDRLVERLGDGVFTNVLYLLCHLQFDAADAKGHWDLALAHRRKLSDSLGRDVDLRVALLDYFISVDHRIQNPKIVEIQIFQQTEDHAIRDELTGLHNYRYFVAELDRELKRALRGDAPFAVAIFDLDHFKWYNDRNGHLAGDNALRAIGEIFRSAVREVDIVARYGGEEFAVLLGGLKKPEALEVAKRMCRAIEEHEFAFGARQPRGRLSASGGVAGYRVDGTTAAELLDAADRALYLAKGRGRAQVVAACDENREHRRVNVEIQGTLRKMQGPDEHFVTTDVSSGGLRLATGVAIDSGDYFRFGLSLPNGGARIDAVAQVLRCDAADNGGYTVAARIVDVSFPDTRALEDFVASGEPG